MNYRKPNAFAYGVVRTASWLAAKLFFRRKVLRNELRGAKGPLVVIANHQCALDFVNLIGLTRRRMHFVISSSFYNTLPCRGIVDALGLIPKQQFQTEPKDLKRMKAVIEAGAPLVIYPAGLMCEDGLSTPIPTATYKFLKWLDADIYVARTAGSYFVMPKWGKGFRPGRTTLDVYKLFDREELRAAELAEIKRQADSALLFDAYREQAKLNASYLGADRLTGLENVLYQCPHCLAEYTVRTEKNAIYCTNCGYRLEGDRKGFLYNRNTFGGKLRYVSDWSAMIRSILEQKLTDAPDTLLSARARICTLDEKRHRFAEAGFGTLTLDAHHFTIKGCLHGEDTCISVPTVSLPCLPFSPGRHLELQCGAAIYRCYPEDSRLVMKFINTLRVLHSMRHPEE